MLNQTELKYFNLLSHLNFFTFATTFRIKWFHLRVDYLSSNILKWLFFLNEKIK